MKRLLATLLVWALCMACPSAWFTAIHNGTGATITVTVDCSQGSRTLAPGESWLDMNVSACACINVSGSGFSAVPSVCWYTGSGGAWAYYTGGSPSPRYEISLSSAAPDQDVFRWEHSVTNNGVLSEEFRLTLNFADGSSTNFVEVLQPGQGLTWDLTHTNAFTVALERLSPRDLVDGMPMWQGQTTPDVEEDTVPGPVTPSNDITPGTANLWGGSGSTALGPLPSPLAQTNAGARGTNFVDAATGTATADANMEKRFKELGQLLVDQDARAAQRAGVQAAQLSGGMDRVRDAVLGVGSALSGILTNGMTNGYMPGGAGPSNGVSLGGLTNGLRSLWPSWSAPSTGGTFTLTLPFSSVDERLSDPVIDFAGETLGPWVGVFRATMLLGISVCFFIACLRLVGVVGGAS